MSKKTREFPSMTTAKHRNRPTIGFFEMNIREDWAMGAWLGAVDAARKHDVNVITFIGEDIGVDHPTNIVYDLGRGGRLDGLVFWKAGLVALLTEAEIEAFCARYGLPMVTMEDCLPGSPCVLYENYRGMYQVIEHLLGVHGYRKIGYMGMMEHHAGFQERYRAYEDAMAAYGAPIDPTLARPWFEFHELTWGRVEAQTLDRYIDNALARGVEAIVGVSDDIAYQAQRKLQERGIHVPEQVAVVGFDDAYESRVLTPPLTTVKAPFYELGYTAAETLIASIAGESVPSVVNVPARLVVRQSCGCPDAYVAAVTTRNLPVRDVSLPVAAFDRATVVSSLVAAACADDEEDLRLEIAPLVGQLVLALSRADLTGQVLAALADALHRTSGELPEMTHWHRIVSALRHQILPRFQDDAAALRRAEDAFQQAQVLIGRIAERMQMARSFRAVQEDNAFRELSLSLITTLDVPTLLDTIATRLPHQGIPGCYLAFYENPRLYYYPDQAPEWSRLMLAYDAAGRIALDSEGVRFPTHQILPSDLWSSATNAVSGRSWVLAPLRFHVEQIGFVLFENSSRKGKIYEALAMLISSALKGALLVRRVREDSVEIARQKYILETFMNNVPDSIYFKDVQSRFIQVNPAFAERFGLSGPHEVIGKTDFDFFAEEMARPKYELEQEILRSGEALLNLEEPDMGERWSLTTKMPLRDEHGVVVGTFGISHDITPLKQAQAMLSRQARQLQTVAEISTAVSTILDKTDLLQQLVDRVKTRFELYHAHLYLLDESSKTLILTAGAGEMGRRMVAEGWRVALDNERSLAARVARTRQGEILNRVQASAVSLPNLLLPEARSELAVPLIAGDVVLGVLDVHAAQEDYFMADDIRIQSTLAGQIAVALQNAGLFEKLEQANGEVRALSQRLAAENLRMSAELDVTRKLQQMLLPTVEELQQIQGLDIAGFMEPAEEVGGDYYDVLLHDGRIKIGIGDVTGHGLESGVIMVMLQTAVRTLLTSEEQDPVRFLSVLNQTLLGNIKRMNANKSLTLLLLDYEKGRLRLSGQHEQLIVARRDGRIELLDTLELGVPIGLEMGIAQFVSELSVNLQPGDGVVLYSDGITESQDANGVYYGLDRLCEVVRRSWVKGTAEAIKQAIVDDIRRHIGKCVVYDDLTLIVLKQQ
ncbi:MAG: SpoIIE family protein phosphatase [Anaerolineae bacterium]|nr:SpoIIE family protein phosphatase [Anaerolineae bacterium]